MADSGDQDKSLRAALGKLAGTQSMDKVTSNLDNTHLDEDNEPSENKSLNGKLT